MILGRGRATVWLQQLLLLEQLSEGAAGSPEELLWHF